MLILLKIIAWLGWGLMCLIIGCIKGQRWAYDDNKIFAYGKKYKITKTEIEERTDRK